MIARFRARLLPQSIRWRLTLWYAAALSAGLGVFAVASLAVLDVELEHRNDQFLRDARQAFLVELAVELGELPTTESAVRMALDEIRFEDTRFFVQTTDVPSVLATRCGQPHRQCAGAYLADGLAGVATAAEHCGRWRWHTIR